MTLYIYDDPCKIFLVLSPYWSVIYLFLFPPPREVLNLFPFEMASRGGFSTLHVDDSDCLRKSRSRSRSRSKSAYYIKGFLNKHPVIEA